METNVARLENENGETKKVSISNKVDSKHFIKQLRKEKGWTQKELAQKLGIPISTVSSYETFRHSPKDWYKLAKIFDVAIPYLQGDSNWKDMTYNEYVSGAYATNPELFPDTEEGREQLSSEFHDKVKDIESYIATDPMLVDIMHAILTSYKKI